MSNIWFAIPSKRPAAEVQARLATWERQGYLTAIWRDAGDPPVDCKMLLQGEYEGYARTVNRLAKEILTEDPDAAFVVCGGDDTDPDLNYRATEIGQQCLDHFGGTFGVMQPTGDRWGACGCGRCIMCKQFGGSAYIDRVAGSPWLGREWCARVNGGLGPLWPDYTHMFSDEETQEVAARLGVFWQRPDLIHLHQHWGKSAQRPPDFLREVNSPSHWKRYGDLFARRKAQGFPGHEPLPVEAEVRECSGTQLQILAEDGN